MITSEVASLEPASFAIPESAGCGAGESVPESVAGTCGATDPPHPSPMPTMPVARATRRTRAGPFGREVGFRVMGSVGTKQKSTSS
jgi:hypothetical protein